MHVVTILSTYKVINKHLINEFQPLSATWCPDNDDEFELEKKKVQIFQQKHESQKSEIDVLKRRIDELASELKKAETRLSHMTNDHSGLPKIYLITPTYARPEQKAELTRLSYTLRHVPNIHWIIVEDSQNKAVLVSKLLAKCKIPYTHLNAATPEIYKLQVRTILGYYVCLLTACIHVRVLGSRGCGLKQYNSIDCVDEALKTFYSMSRLTCV